MKCYKCGKQYKPDPEKVMRYVESQDYLEGFDPTNWECPECEEAEAALPVCHKCHYPEPVLHKTGRVLLCETCREIVLRDEPC